MINRLFPGLSWLEGYRFRTFKSDLFSGLTIAVMLIPQGMGYSLVAGLPPEFGLYACVIPPVIYALLGTSNKISIGPVALDSILILAGLTVIAEPGTKNYAELAILLTLMVGVIQVFFGMIKMGFIANFLSYPVIIGYTSAASIVIMGSQFENLLGAEVEAGNVLQTLYDLIVQVSDWNIVTTALGVGGILFLLGSKRLGLALPYPFILLAFGMLISGMFDLESFGVSVVANIPQGLPGFDIPQIDFESFLSLVPLAFTVALMGYVGSMSICKSLEKPTDKIYAKPNQELLALGMANLVGAFFRAFPVSASFSRSAAFRAAGAKTQISAVISSIFIAIVLLLLVPVFERFPLPETLLAVVVIVSVAGLFKYKDMKILARYNRKEFLVCLITFFATVLVSVQVGLIIGVLISVIMMVYKTANPHMTELGAINDGSLFRNINRFKEATVREDTLIFRFDAPLYFANKDYFVEKLYTWIKRRNPMRLKYVVLEAESVNSVDATALLMLNQVSTNLESQGIRFCIANAIGPVRDAIKNSELHKFVCQERMFSTIHDAMSYIDKGVATHSRAATQTNCS